MKHFALVLTTGMLLSLGISSAEAHPRHYAHSHRSHVVVEKQVVVKPAPVRNLVARTVGQLFDTVPNNHVRVVHQGRNYFVADGVYYVRDGARYKVVKPVTGVRIAALPSGYTTVRVNGQLRYRYNNITYRRVNNVYVVV